jgi:hypothetical protein
VDPLEEYLASYDAAAGRMFVQLDEAIRTAAGVLRPGTSTLMTWDMPRGTSVDTAAVASYVQDALATRDHFLANAERISADARERARDR